MDCGLILTLPELQKFRDAADSVKLSVVVTNGCFDVLHYGHISYLEQASKLGDLLIVGINGDESVRQLKGNDRPIYPAAERAEMLRSLRFVNVVCVFDGVRCVDFLLAARPTVYVKGGDYTIDSLDSGEKAAIVGNGAIIRFLPMVPGRSTSSTLAKLQQ